MSDLKAPTIHEPVYRFDVPSPKPLEPSMPFLRRAVWNFDSSQDDRDSQVAAAFGDAEEFEIQRLKTEEVSRLRHRIWLGQKVVQSQNGLHYVTLYERDRIRQIPKDLLK